MKTVEFCQNLKISKDDKLFIMNCLPQGWKTQVVHYSGQNKKEIHIYINAKTKEDTYKWIESYQKLTNSCYSIESGGITNGPRITYKKRYNCIHRTRNPGKYDSTNRKSIKKLGCPACVIIVFRASRKCKKELNKKKICEIRLRFYHNHSVNDPALLKFHKILPDIKIELLNLFKLGYTPAKALKCLRNIIKIKFKNKYNCPNYNYVYDLHTKYINENKIIDDEYLSEWVENSISNTNVTTIDNEEEYLNDLINEFNSKIDDVCAELAITEDGYVICCCPPIAKRVHQYEKTCSEIVFIETFYLSDPNNSRIYMFLSPSEIGCLPLGIILTTSENTSTLRIGFTLLKEMLDSSAFGGNQNGPKIFIIDTNLSEETFLPSIWPRSKNVISAYHALKDIWLWLTSPENNITKEDQPFLFKDFYNTLYAENDATFQINFGNAKKNCKSYENYKNLLDDYYKKKELWGLCYRPEILKSYTTIIQYSQITIRFLKEMLMQKINKLNFVQIVDFFINVFFQYINQRLINMTKLELINKKKLNDFYWEIKLPDENFLNRIQNIGQSLRFVPSENVDDLCYVVNINLCKCTCVKDDSISICKHIQWVCKLKYTDQFYENLKNIQIRKKCCMIATERELKYWLSKPEFQENSTESVEKTTQAGINNDNDNIKIQIINDDNSDVTSNKIQLNDNFVSEYFKVLIKNSEKQEETPVSNKDDEIIIIDDDSNENIETTTTTTNNDQKDKNLETPKDLNNIIYINIDTSNEKNTDIVSDKNYESTEVVECKYLWNKITNIFEKVVKNSSEDFLPAITEIGSKFQQITTVSELRNTFNI